MLPFSMYQSKAHMQEHAKGYEFLARAIVAEERKNLVFAIRCLEHAARLELRAFGLVELTTT